jgi:hypothetical protein
MALTKIKDLPYFQVCNQAPIATATLSYMASDESGVDDRLFYITGSSFYSYNPSADMFQLRATPNVAPVTVLALKYTKRRGFHTRVISATSTTVVIGGLKGEILNGENIRILSGTGQGQERQLTFVGETIHDYGVITGTAANYLQDNLKKWKFNQWAGYLVGITFGTDATQYKRILYNDATTLYISDANLMPHNPWENQPFVAIAPYALPVTTAGSQAHYQISSQEFSVTAWNVTPNNTSFATTLTGGLYLVSSAAAAPFFTLQYYDVAADNWISKTCPQSLIGALGTDIALERTAKVGTPFVSSTATSGGSRTIVDTSLNLEVDRYENYRILITGGTGVGQNRRIVCNTSTTFTVARAWDTAPNATSTYEVWGDFDRLYLAGNGSSAMFAYSAENDYWMQGQAFDDGITSNISVTMLGWAPLGVTSGARIAAGITGINATPTAGGTNYLVGDILTCSVGGTGARVIVTSINPGGIVTGLELIASGTATGFVVGTGRATTGGTGTGCTIEITSVGVTVLVTTATAHWFRTGQQVTFAGCTDALYNAQYTILCVGATTTFDIITTAAATMVATTSQSTTTIVDPTKAWTANEHVGKLVHLMVAGIAPTSQIRWIVSNTPTSVTVATITAGINGTSKYVIYDSKIFGVDCLRRISGQRGWGHATGGSTTTLIDSSKNWLVNQWIGFRFRIEAGTGFGSGLLSVTSNTTNTLTYALQSFTADSSTHYEIQDTWGLATAGSTTSITETTTKAWAVNQFAGKRVRLTGGTGLGQEATVASNTSTALTTGTITTGDATTTYAILCIPPRGAGLTLLWLWGTTNSGIKGKYLFMPRGAATNQIDFYNICSERYEAISHFIPPQQELWTSGSMYAYDSKDIVYMHNLGRISIYDITKNRIDSAFQLAGTHNTAIIGNRMEIIQDSLLNKYLYIMQHSGTIMWRVVIF